MPNLNDLARILREAKDTSSNELKIVSSDLLPERDTLNSFGLKYEITREGVEIDLAKSAQPAFIYKSAESALKHLSEAKFSKPIIVLEIDPDHRDFALFSDDERSVESFFENARFHYKFRDLFVARELASYQDHAAQKLVFLSPIHGRFNIAYRKYWNADFYLGDWGLGRVYEELVQLLEDPKFEDFLRESIVEYAKTVPEENARFYQILRHVRHIAESAKRNYELYKTGFSFSEFKRGVDEQAEKFLKDYQASLSDFLAKIASMPVQFGVYIFLLVRFWDEMLPLAATGIIMLAWTVLTCLAVNRLVENVNHLKGLYSAHLEKLKKAAGVEEAVIEEERQIVLRRFSRSISLIKSYRGFVVVFFVAVMGLWVAAVLGAADSWGRLFNIGRHFL